MDVILRILKRQKSGWVTISEEELNELLSVLWMLGCDVEYGKYPCAYRHDLGTIVTRNTVFKEPRAFIQDLEMILQEIKHEDTTV